MTGSSRRGRAPGDDAAHELAIGVNHDGGPIRVESASDWRRTNGASTTPTGVVGAADFAANRDSFGRLTYVFGGHRTGQQLQVLNDRVE